MNNVKHQHLIMSQNPSHSILFIASNSYQQGLNDEIRTVLRRPTYPHLGGVAR